MRFAVARQIGPLLAPLLSSARLVSMTASRTHGVAISSAFDAGNIEVVDDKGGVVGLKIKQDPYTELEKKNHMQWFALRATVTSEQMPAAPTKYEVLNAGDVSFPGAWEGTEIVASVDRKTWTRVESTTYDKARKVLCWEWQHTADAPSVYFAYFDLYSYERQLDLVAACAAATAPGSAALELRPSSTGRAQLLSASA